MKMLFYCCPAAGTPGYAGFFKAGGYGRSIVGVMEISWPTTDPNSWSEVANVPFNWFIQLRSPSCCALVS
jgi:hypothetical protein